MSRERLVNQEDAYKTPQIRYIRIFRSPYGKLGVDDRSDRVIVHHIGSSKGHDFYQAKLEAYPKVLSGYVAAIQLPDGSCPKSDISTVDDWVEIPSCLGSWWAFAHWNPEKKRYESALHNTVGTLEVRTETLSLDLEVSHPDLTADDLRDAIEQFRVSLLGLLEKRLGLVTRVAIYQRMTVFTDQKDYETVGDLIDSIGVLEEHLKSRLFRLEAPMTAGRARVSKRGERQYQRRPDSKKLWSYVSEETYDTGENRFVLFVAKSLHQFLKMLQRNRVQIQKDFKDRSSYLEERRRKKVSGEWREGYEREIKYLERCEAERQALLEKIDEQEISGFISTLSVMIERLHAKGIKDIYTTFNPMVFIQNPLYRAFYQLYVKLHLTFELVRSSNHIDAILGRVTLNNLPNFYERWCLVQIFEILIQEFKFRPLDEKWTDTLLEGCAKNKADMAFRFRSPNDKEITLTYQAKIASETKRTENGNPKIYTPDFVIKTKNRKWVLDAKFRTKSSEGEIMELCRELAENKDYAQRTYGKSNAVFILHCAPEIGRVTPFNETNNWSLFCNYGSHADYSDKIKEPTKSSYLYNRGHIFASLKAEYREQSFNHLKRLILMILQDAEIIICPNCGTLMTKVEAEVFDRETEDFKKDPRYECTCGTVFRSRPCFQCHQKLWKNDWEWSYNEITENCGNMRCPHCGADFSINGQ